MSIALRHLQRRLHFAKCVSSSMLSSSSSSSSSYSSAKWDLVSAVCVERKPVVTPAMNQLEIEMTKMLQRKELEQSMLNDHEIKYRRDKERQERKRRGEILEGDEEEVEKTTHDLEDAWKKDAKDFVPASRITEADINNDLRSLDRKLDKTLRLVLQVKLGNDIFWELPSAKRADGESMRETAERAVSEVCGEGAKVQVVGNAPWGFYKYKYPRKHRGETVGAKVFVFKGHLSPGAQIEAGEEEEEVVDFLWATLEEMGAWLRKDVLKSVTNIIPDEDWEERVKRLRS